MIPTLLDKPTLQLINRRTLRYTPVAAEKVYFLTLALKILSESPLFPTLVFKGGTALHHCYLPQSRFSEDLDFTSLDKLITGDALTNLFAPYPFFEVKKLYTSKATIKIERLKYSGVLDMPNSLKFEVDRLQDVVLPARQLPYANVWGIDVMANVNEYVPYVYWVPNIPLPDYFVFAGSQSVAVGAETYARDNRQLAQL
jgi:hypothetical protein